MIWFLEGESFVSKEEADAYMAGLDDTKYLRVKEYRRVADPMADIVKELRELAQANFQYDNSSDMTSDGLLCIRAADEIERLRALLSERDQRDADLAYEMRTR